MRGALLVAGLILAPLPLRAEPAASVPAAGSEHLVEALESSHLALVGRVDAPRKLDAHGRATSIEVEKALVGSTERGRVIHVAWEEPSLGRPERFAAGDRVLLCLEPLPPYSIWSQRLPDPEERLHTLAVAEQGRGFLRDPSPGALLLLEHYLALLPDERAGVPGVAYLAQLAEGAELPLARSAVARLAALPDLDAGLDELAARRLVAALLRPDADEALRAGLLDLFGQQRPEAVHAALLARLAAPGRPPPLVVAALGRVEGELDTERAERLLRSPDPELRALAARHAPASQAPRLATLAATDPEPEVRAAAVTRLVASQGEASIDAALVALDDPEPTVRTSAAQALARLGAPVVPALRQVVDAGSPEAAQAAVGALRWTETIEARRELVEIAAGHPDAGVRALARLAIGRSLDAEAH